MNIKSYHAWLRVYSWPLCVKIQKDILRGVWLVNKETNKLLTSVRFRSNISFHSINIMKSLIHDSITHSRSSEFIWSLMLGKHNLVSDQKKKKTRNKGRLSPLFCFDLLQFQSESKFCRNDRVWVSRTPHETELTVHSATRKWATFDKNVFNSPKDTQNGISVVLWNPCNKI